MEGKTQGRPLLPQAERFCREYVVDCNAAAAARRAGYSEHTARQQGHRLLCDPRVQESISRHARRVHERIELDAGFVLGGLKQNALRCQQAEPVYDSDGNPTGEYRFDSMGSNRAFELLGKHLRLFTDRIEATVTMEEVRDYVRRLCAIVHEELDSAFGDEGRDVAKAIIGRLREEARDGNDDDDSD